MASAAIHRIVTVFGPRRAEPKNVVCQLFSCSTTGSPKHFSDLLLKAIDDNQRSLLMLVYFSLLSVPLLLYTFRFADNNRLISWYWSISQQQMFVVLAVLVFACAAAMILAKQKLSDRHSAKIFTLSAFVLSIPFWNIPEIIIDNARYFSQAKYLELFGVSYFFQEWGNSIFAWTDLPLMPFIYGLAFKLLGEQRFIIQTINSLFFAGTLWVTYELGRTLWSQTHGLLGAVLMFGFPYLYSQIPLMLVDIPTMFFISAALLATVEAMKRGKFVRISIAVISITLAVMCKYSTWLLLSVIPLTLLIYAERTLKTRVKCLAQIAFGVMLFLGIICLWNYEVFLQQLEVLFTYQWNALDRWQESTISTFFFQVHPLLSIAAFVGILIAVKKREIKFLVISWMLLLVLMLEINRIRYLMVIFPMLALMAAYALAEIPNVQIRRFIGYGVALSSYVIGLTIAAGFMQTTSANNLQAAGKYLDALDVQTVDVIILPQHNSVVNTRIALPTLDYHTSKNVVYRRDKAILTTQTPANIDMSPVRFTWEYPVPNYYFSDVRNSDVQVLALIYSDPEQLKSEFMQTALQNYRLEKQFLASSGVFKFKTLVNLYIPVY